MLVACAGSPSRGPVERLAIDEETCVDGWPDIVPHAIASTQEGRQRERMQSFAGLVQCVRRPDGTLESVALFSLGELQPPIEVSLTLSGGPRGTLAAALVMMDEQFRPMRRYGFEEFTRRGTDRNLNVFINPVDANIRYLVITPDANHVGSNDRLITGRRWTAVIVTPAVMGSYSDGVESIIEIPLTDTGGLQITAKPFTTKALSDD